MLKKMKTKKSPKALVVSRPLITKKVLIVSILAVVAVGFALQILFNLLVYSRLIRSDANGQIVISSLIINAVEGLNKPAVIEPISNRQYLPDAKLVLPPATAPNDQLLYSYTAYTADNGPHTELSVTTKQAVHTAESRLWDTQADKSYWGSSNMIKTFDQVPNLQACVRGVHLYFDAKSGNDSGYKLEASKPLEDGRTVYIFTETGTICHVGFGSLVEYLKQVQSY